MDREDDVVKWKTVAAAFHAGALDDCEGFETLEDAVRHLYNYQWPGAGPGRGFFGNGVADRCVLCQHIIVTDEFRYETWYPEDVARGERSGQRVEPEALGTPGCYAHALLCDALHGPGAGETLQLSQKQSF
ncbi:hypothetical protein KUCAC02_025124 [Chaenocephalus aceratus]|nr:hypothetical protein KUCAC02_025124 [Chaenocephalus aceratus]